MNKKIIASAILSVLSFGAMAETPSFNVIKAGYVSDFDSNGFDGFIFEGEAEINDMFYVNGEYADLGVSGTDIQTFAIGLGYKSSLSTSSTLFAELNYLNATVDFDFGGFGGSVSENGYEAKLGMKSMVAKNIQLSGALVYTDLEDSNTTLELGSVYEFTDNFGAYADIETDFDDSTYAVGIRFTF